MRVIDQVELLQLMRNAPDLILVEVLGHDVYEDWHLPGAINIPLDDRFDERVGHFIPDTDRMLVVYCGSETCAVAPKSAERLEHLGYSRVHVYKGGKKDWRDADLPIER